MTSSCHAAVDLGASSGRVVVGEVGPDVLRLTEAHRFVNRPVRLPSGLHWDVLGLYAEALEGLAIARRAHDRLDSVGVDSWAVDYGLLDEREALLGNPFHYRDGRTDDVPAQVHAQTSHAELYAVNGLQLLPFNTCYQLIAAQGTAHLRSARTLLLIPDLINLWLAGNVGAEATNASTTGLLDARSRQWSDSLCAALGIERSLLPSLHQPGAVLGPLLPHVREQTGIAESTLLTAVGSHDTASAVVGVPMAAEGAAYISLGTWGLVGLELEQPVLTEQSRSANFTNELGVDGRVRYLRNVMGLWLLQESLRTWAARGEPADLQALLAAASALPAGGPRVDVDDLRFLPPGDMPARVRQACGDAGDEQPEGAVAVVRCILDSLALALARAVGDAARLAGREVKVVHVVGGGAQNPLLCQLTADACGLPVVAGPVEATAIGNVLVQARSVGTLTGDVDSLRALVRRTQDVQTFVPRTRAVSAR